jgi:hypothetical protein
MIPDGTSYRLLSLVARRSARSMHGSPTGLVSNMACTGPELPEVLRVHVKKVLTVNAPDLIRLGGGARPIPPVMRRYLLRRRCPRAHRSGDRERFPVRLSMTSHGLYSGNGGGGQPVPCHPCLASSVSAGGNPYPSHLDLPRTQSP